MALTMDFMDASGVAHQSVHFRCVQINIGAAEQVINLMFYGYKDLEAFATGKQHLPGAMKSYNVTGNEFLGIAASPPVGNILYDVLAHAAETYAIGKLDVDSGRREQITTPVLEPKTEKVQEPEKDINGNPVLDDQGNPVMVEVTKFVLDDQGNRVMIPVLDADGKPVVNVTQGPPIMVSFFDGAQQV